MDAWPDMLKVVGVILAVWTLVPSVVLVTVVRLWQRYYERTDPVSVEGR